MVFWHTLPILGMPKRERSSNLSHSFCKGVQSGAEPLTSLRTKEFIERHNIDCEFTYRDTYDMCMTPEYHQLVEKAIADYRAAGGTPRLQSVDPELAKKARHDALR